MSIVTDILQTAGTLNKIDVYNKLNEYLKKLEEIKIELLASIDKYYSSHRLTCDFSESLENKFTKNIENIEKLNAEINYYMKLDEDKNSEINNSLLKDSKRLKETIFFIEAIIKINSSLQSAEALFRSNDYLTAACLIEENRAMITSLGTIKVYGHFRSRNAELEESLTKKLEELYSKNYTWTINDDESDNSSLETLAELTIHNDIGISGVLSALDKLGLLQLLAADFSRCLLRHFIAPICEKACTLEKRGLTIATSEVAIDPNRKLTDMLLSLLEFLESSMKSDGEKLFLEKIGKHLSESFTDVLIEKGYKLSIRASKEEMEKATFDFSAFKQIEEKAKELKLIIDAGGKLDYFNKSIDELFIQEKCLDMLLKCRDLITTPLHNYVHSSQCVFPAAVSTDDSDFQPCLISVMMRDFTTNCYALVNEAKSQNNCHTLSFMECLNDIILLYITIAPKHHMKITRTLPLVAALFQNNCNFLSHHMKLILLTAKERWPDLVCANTLELLVQQVRGIGIAALLQFIAQQKLEIISCIDLDGLPGAGENDNSQNTLRSIHQANLQIKHLHTVWTEALPLTTAHMVIGVLINAAMTHITNSVLRMADISQSDGKVLVSIIDSIIQLASQLLAPTPLPTVVPRINRLKELKFVIEASLEDLQNRWASGRGPLSQEFNAVEIEALVKALFQNTKRRAALLAAIK